MSEYELTEEDREEDAQKAYESTLIWHATKGRDDEITRLKVAQRDQYRRLIQARIELCRWKAHALYLEREATASCWENQRARLDHRVKALRKAEAKLVALRASNVPGNMMGK